MTRLLVTLNLFQGPSRLIAQAVRDQKWMLKQVQHDGSEPDQ
jgi:hypothetical protein